LKFTPVKTGMKQNNFKVAITGGIGSGKSAVAEIIAESGYNVISCDDEYKKLLSEREFISKLSLQFVGVAAPDGSIDKRKLSERVFNNEAELKKLNALTHPLIMKRVLKAMQGKGVYFCEVPLLFEGGFEKLFDGVIVVLRDRNERISAVVERDNLTEKKVEIRINSQINYENFEFKEYYVIHNNGNLSDLRLKTRVILQQIEKSLQ